VILELKVYIGLYVIKGIYYFISTMV